MPDIFIATDKNQESVQKQKDVLDEKPITPVDSFSDNGNSIHLFTSYCENPKGITFENQEEDEKILLFIKKDLITNLPWIIFGILFSLLPIIITPILLAFHLPVFLIPQKFILLFIAFYYLLTATYFFINFISWYFNIDIVTEKRIIDVEFEGVVYKNVAATKITLVQDVSYSQVGVVRTMFDYGDVLVQTAGTIDNFKFESVPRPEDAVHVIENLIGKK